MTRGRAAVGWLLALAATCGRARADDAGPGLRAPVPVPPRLAALVATDAEEALAARALAALDDPAPAIASRAARELLLAGPAGLREAVRRLADGVASDAARLPLVEVVGASDLPEVDAVLAAVATTPRTEVRALVARALGAGRTGLAVDTLARLARDPAPGVRAAALRALFAIESSAATAARIALPADRDPDLTALRLRLHRLRGDEGPTLRTFAATAFALARAPGVRVEAARWLATHDGPEEDDLLALAVAETWSPPTEAAALRARLGVPTDGYTRADARCAGTEALLALVCRPTTPVATRAALVELAVDALAHPATGSGAEADEEARATLEARLPAVGAALVGPTTRRLVAGAFVEPRQGVRLLAALPADLAVTALGDVVLAGPPEDVTRHAAGALAAFRRVGRDAVARALLDPRAPSDVRAAGVSALADEPEALASRWLVAALDDPDGDVAGRAAEVLLERRARGETSAWAPLAATLSAPPLRPFERTLLDTLARAPDPDVYALFDRMLTLGPVQVRRDVLDAMRSRTSRMRTPEGAALVSRAAAEPALGLRPADIAPALTAVAGPAGVDYVRARWRQARAPGVFLRNLRQVRHVSALDLALEIAASLPDTETALLNELMTVLSDGPALDPSRTDPFWRRMLAHPDRRLVEQAIHTLRGVAHGPMSPLLVPVVVDATRPAWLRADALVGCAGEADQPPTDVLWRIAADRGEDDELRREATSRLVHRADPTLRRRALAWLAEGVDQESEVVDTMSSLAGSGASPGEAADLLALFDENVAIRFASVPYFRAGEAVDDDTHRAAVARAASLLRATVATADPPTLAALATRVFDARFARYAVEARRHAALGRGGGGGPTAAGVDPPEAGLLLYTDDADPDASPVSPLPHSASEIVAALTTQGPADAPLHLVAALERTRASGSLALFSDAYVVTLMRRLGDASRRRADAPSDPARTTATDAALNALGAALARTWPVAGVEELWAAEQRLTRFARVRRFSEAAAAAATAARLAARTGLCDLSPSRWLAAGHGVPKDVYPWQTLRARQDLLEGAAAAATGRDTEAHEAFRRGLARAPDRPGLLRLAAHLKHAVGFDLAGASLDLRRAVDLARASGEGPTREDEALLRALRVVGADDGDRGPSEDAPR